MTASYSERLLTYDAISGLFMTIKLRPRQPSCEGCNKHSQLLQTIDYVQWCGGTGPDDKVSVTYNLNCYYGDVIGLSSEFIERQ